MTIASLAVTTASLAVTTARGEGMVGGGPRGRSVARSPSAVPPPASLFHWFMEPVSNLLHIQDIVNFKQILVFYLPAEIKKQQSRFWTHL